MTSSAPQRPKLSIADAWDEANAFIRAELALLAPVALAFLALPAAVADLVQPDAADATLAPGLALILVPLCWVVQLLGTLAIVILAVKPGLLVADALRAALRRMPSALGVAGLLFAALIVLLVPVLPYVKVPGHPAATPNGPVLLYMLMLGVGLLIAGVRLLLANVVVAAEALRPIAALRRSFMLTRGATWRLLGFTLMFMLFGIVVILATKAGLGSLLLMVGRLTGRESLAEIVSTLLSATVAAALTGWLAVILARFYARLAGWASSGI